MSSIFVTSHLVVGDVPTHLRSFVAVAVTSAEEAVKVIDRGGIAVLPAGDWEAAAQVLRLFGADEEHITRQIDMSRQPGGGSFPAHL